MTLCTSIDTLAMAYLDDELADEELRDFELHLHDCAACRGRVDAERHALADLRRALAPPPAPALVRARIAARLDDEDAQAARDARRGRLAGWLLPGAASLAAVAALAVFVLLPEGRVPSPATVAGDVARSHARTPRLHVAPLPVIASSAAAPSPVYPVATWRSEINGRAGVAAWFVERRGGDDQRIIQATRFDARGWNLAIGERVLVDGLELWGASTPDGMFIVLHRRGNVGYAFSSDDLAPRDLLSAIARHDLVGQMR
jgi:hypothetical protein